MSEPKAFLFRRWIDGAWFCGEVSARDWKDAEDWCKRAGVALDGEHVATIPAIAPSWFADLVVGVRNFFRGKP